MRLNRSKFNTWVLIAGILVFGVQFIMAAIFCNERLYMDSAYYIFYTINNEWFKVDHQRFVLAISELLPLAGVKLNLSLKVVLLLYSLGHVLFFFSVFLILFFALKDEFGAIAILILTATNVQILYFTPMQEVWYGAAFGVLLFSLLRKEIIIFKYLLIISLVEITVVFSHPENFILVFLYLLMDIERRRSFKIHHWVILSVFIASIIFKFFTFSDYEAAKAGWALDFKTNADHLNMFHKWYVWQLVNMLITNYWFVLLLLLSTFLYYLYSKQILRGIIVIVCFAGTLVLVNSVFSANFYIRYVEALNLPLISIATVPFVYDILERSSIKIIIFIFIIIVIAFGMRQQISYAKPFIQRDAQMERIIHYCDGVGGNKFFIDSVNFIKSYTKLDWSFPMEALLISAERGKDSCRSVATDDDLFNASINNIFTDSTLFMFRRFEIGRDNDLNKKYFIAHPGVYKKIDYKE